ncbi:DinB family protein [Streptomyces reniochalinae]|uniref:DinB family protein n=1 Tax=Streptomyces reniochalinae TaxID=2250578 RepID=A0A367E753_9ACTN|nr:DinB family protein [Streptomyces reniochalinae]RCG13831.1 DinB family protein [Streptomyces reniochalinae]
MTSPKEASPEGPPLTLSGVPLPEGTGSERQILQQWLDLQRATLAAKCEGLSDEELRRAAAPPSALTLLGLVRHMTDVERHWFRRMWREEDSAPLYRTPQAPDDDFVVTEAGTGEETLAAWRREIDRARASAAGRSLDEVATHPRRTGWRTSLRWMYTHMIQEYARHNGHADLLRERIDGKTGF